MRGREMAREWDSEMAKKKRKERTGEEMIQCDMAREKTLDG